MQSRQSGLVPAVLALTLGITSACGHTQQTFGPPPGPSHYPTADEINSKMQQVRTDPKYNDEQKKMLLNEMQHALNNPQGGIPRR